MENRQMKCIKGESCLHCGSNYCRFVNELDQLKQTLAEIKEIAKTFCDECKEFGGRLHQDRDCMYCNYGKILQKIR